MARLFRIALFITLCSFVLALPLGAEPFSKDHLKKAVRYLDLLDQGRFAEAWQAMSPIFRAMEQQAKWQNRQEAVRGAYGALELRDYFLAEARSHYNLSPDGHYVIVQFKSSFQNKAATTETVVLDCSAKTECSIREYVIR